MAPLVFIFSLLFLFQQPQPWPQSNPFTDSQQIRDEWRRAYAKFKPGPRVLAELEKLKLHKREALNLWNDGEYTLQMCPVSIDNLPWVGSHLL